MARLFPSISQRRGGRGLGRVRHRRDAERQRRLQRERHGPRRPRPCDGEMYVEPVDAERCPSRHRRAAGHASRASTCTAGPAKIIIGSSRTSWNRSGPRFRTRRESVATRSAVVSINATTSAVKSSMRRAPPARRGASAKAGSEILFSPAAARTGPRAARRRRRSRLGLISRGSGLARFTVGASARDVRGTKMPRARLMVGRLLFRLQFAPGRYARLGRQGRVPDPV